MSLLENFCMDFTLLYCAKAVTKNRARRLRLVLAAAAGAAFAVVFPIIPVGAVFAVIIKIAAGFLIALLACNMSSFGAYLKFSCAFVGFTFLLGGALTALFSLTGLKAESGAGYLISSIPVGIPMFGALMAVLLAKYLAKRLSKSSPNTVRCRIYAGQSDVELPAFFDSGNKVFYKGRPVSVIPEAAAKKLVDAESINEGVKIHTVAGSRTIKVFTADKVIIYDGNTRKILRNVELGVSPNRIARAVLHPDLLED